MPLFAEAEKLTPEQIQKLADEAARLQALPPEQVAALPTEQLQQAHQVIEQARWAAEVPYFRFLHDILPAPFFQTQGFLLFFLVVGDRVLAVAATVEHRAGLAAGGRQLPLLRRLERQPGAARHRDGDARLPARPRDGRAPTDAAGSGALMWASILMNLGVLATSSTAGSSSTNCTT